MLSRTLNTKYKPGVSLFIPSEGVVGLYSPLEGSWQGRVGCGIRWEGRIRNAGGELVCEW
jgi:hypothetical protein